MSPSRVGAILLVITSAVLPTSCAPPLTQSSQRAKAEAFYETGNEQALRSMAETGDIEAQYLLAKMHVSGWGAPAWPEEALRWARSAATKGHVDAGALLGGLLLLEDPPLRNRVEALQWLNASASHDSRFAEFYLGRAYAWGLGVPRDRPAAIQWYERSASMGLLASQYALAKLLSKEASDDSLRKAKVWRTRADATVRRGVEEKVARFKAARGRAVLHLSAEWCRPCLKLGNLLLAYTLRSRVERIAIDCTEFDAWRVITGVLVENGLPRTEVVPCMIIWKGKDEYQLLSGFDPASCCMGGFGSGPSVPLAEIFPSNKLLNWKFPAKNY